MRLIVILVVFVLSSGLSAANALQQEALDAQARLTDERIGFTVQGRYTNYTLTITGPEGFVARAQGQRSAPTVRLADHGATPDGLYTYQLTAATDRIDPSARRVDQRTNGREPGVAAPLIGALMTGQFRVENDRIRIFEQIDEPAPQDG